MSRMQRKKAPAQHSVHPTGGSLRVFRQFAWLEVGSVKMVFSRLAHQRVTQTVRRFNAQEYVDVRQVFDQQP
jgi:hypothetical protein